MNTRKRKIEPPTKTRKTVAPTKNRKGKCVAVTQTRKSKQLAESKDVTVSLDASSDSTKGDDSVEVSDMSTNHLGTYKKRPVICERVVAVWELKGSQIPDVVKNSKLEPMCSIKGRANMTLVREFFAGIDVSTVGLANKSLVTVVRGTRIVITPDAFAKFKKFIRPLAHEPQFPYQKGDKRTSWKEIWPTLCRDGREPNENDIIMLRDLRRDFLFLHHMFWWNVNPRPPRLHVTKDQAIMLYEVYNGRQPDIALLWFYCVYAAYDNEHSNASLPLAILLTQIMMDEYKVGHHPQDEWKKQSKPLGRATIGKSEGQIKSHRVSNTPTIETVEGNNDMLVSLHEQVTEAVELLYDMNKRQKRMEKRQISIAKRVTMIEKKLGMGNGEQLSPDSGGEDNDESASHADDNDGGDGSQSSAREEDGEESEESESNDRDEDGDEDQDGDEDADE